MFFSKVNGRRRKNRSVYFGTAFIWRYDTTFLIIWQWMMMMICSHRYNHYSDILQSSKLHVCKCQVWNISTVFSLSEWVCGVQYTCGVHVQRAYGKRCILCENKLKFTVFDYYDWAIQLLNYWFLLQLVLVPLLLLLPLRVSVSVFFPYNRIQSWYNRWLFRHSIQNALIW